MCVNRTEYLKQLSSHLKKMTKEEHDEIMADFGEYFSCAAKEGRDEASVCERLGDPRKIAKEYYMQKMIEEANQKKTFKSMGRAVAASAGLGIANFFYAVCVVGVGYIVIASLYIAVCSVGLASAATIILSLISLGTFSLPGALFCIFAGIALAALSVLGFIGIMKFAGLFAKGNMRFLNMTRRGIRGGLEDEQN
jgi:uncharacterized membrane protein